MNNDATKKSSKKIDDPFFDKLDSLWHETSLMVICIRGNIIIESMLDKLLAEVLPSKNIKDFKKLGVAPKVDLCIALGAMPTDLKTLLNLLNKYRNKFAHEDSFELTGRQIKNLSKVKKEVLSVFPDLRPALTEQEATNSNLERFKNTVLMSAFSVYWCLTNYVKSKAYNKILFEEFETAVFKAAPRDYSKKTETDLKREQKRLKKVMTLFDKRWKEIWE